LPPDIGRIDTPGQKQASFKNRLFADDVDQFLKFHARNMPQMAYYCNDFLDFADFSPMAAVHFVWVGLAWP
jgi:hypothetical protein